MAKKKHEKTHHVPTRRQRSHFKQQKRRQRIILFVSLAIVVAVLSVIGVGVYKNWYLDDYKPLHETVLEVNGTEFDMEYYADMLLYYTVATGMSAEYASLFTDMTASAIERDELVKQAAAEMGVTVSDDEVRELMESTDPPVAERYRHIAVTQLIAQKLYEGFIDEQVPQRADQRHVMAMFLEGEELANEVIFRIASGVSFAEIAAELSLDETTKEAEGDLGWCPAGLLPLKVDSQVLEENAFSLEAGAISEPIYEADKSRNLGYWLIEVVGVDREAEPVEAQTRVMLLESEALATEVLVRLDAGESFADLALEYSKHTESAENGGEYTASPGTTTTAFDDYVFAEDVELEVVSQPIKDDESKVDGGYWVIEISEVSINRQIEEESRDLLKEEVMNQWIDSLVADENNVIVNYLDDEKKQWAVSHVMGG
ncbi:MAG: peptidylprolyl isomerase [Dehalococcoidia bacterium]